MERTKIRNNEDAEIKRLTENNMYGLKPGVRYKVPKRDEVLWFKECYNGGTYLSGKQIKSYIAYTMLNENNDNFMFEEKELKGIKPFKGKTLYEKEYDSFWKDLLEKNGKLDMDAVKRELFDYSYAMHEVACVYGEITGGRMSKINYPHQTVIGEFEEVRDKNFIDKDYVRDIIKLYKNKEITAKEMVKDLEEVSQEVEW